MQILIESLTHFQIVTQILYQLHSQSITNLAVLLFWEIGFSIGDGDGNGFGRSLDVVEDKTNGDCVDDILVEPLDRRLRVPWAREESWRLGETLRGVWRVFNLNLKELSKIRIFNNVKSL